MRFKKTKTYCQYASNEDLWTLKAVDEMWTKREHTQNSTNKFVSEAALKNDQNTVFGSNSTNFWQLTKQATVCVK